MKKTTSHLTLTLTTILAMGFAAKVTAQDFWAHRFATEIDIAYGGEPLQTLDRYIQGERVGEPDYFKPAQDPRPTLMWIHGGGWVVGDKADNLANVMPYVEAGWNVYNVNYRQGPNTAPQAVDDVMCAYRFIVDQVKAAGQDPDNIVVSGASAGGHLSLAVGLLNVKGDHPCRSAHPPVAVVNWFGITDISLVDEFLQENRPNTNYARTWAGSVEAVQEVSDQYSPIYLISDAAPPIITIHGTDDTVVPYDQAESFHSSLNTPNELVTLAQGNHSGFTDAQYNEAYLRIFKFLKAL
ncbi:MAG: alpha/beta hydrolase [Pseudomonadota bacterium]